MRVYFAPCGIGLGHVGRIVPIAKKLREKHVQLAFSTYRDGICYVENEKFPLMKAPPIGFQVKPDGSIDFRQTAVNPGPFFASFTLLKQTNAEVKFIESFNPDGGSVRITTKDKMWDLVRKEFTHTYDSGIDASAGKISEIFKDIVTTYGGLL